MEKHDLKKRVTELAHEQLYKIGVTRLRIDTLCAELGISKRTFYELFETKEQLIELCFSKTLQEHRAVVMEIEKESTPYKKLCDLLDFYVSFIYKLQPALYKDAYIKQSYLQIIEDLKGFWLHIIKKSLEDCSEHMIKGLDCGLYSRFIVSSINNCRLDNYPLAKTEDLVFLFVRGCIKREFLFD